jgi:glutathione S-transferase
LEKTVKLIIGNKNYSSWSLRPWLLLAHHNLPFEEIRIGLDQDDTQAKLARYTDAGKLPVLLDGELRVWDSLAICEYVSDLYLDGRGWPGELTARAQARACCAEMHAGFAQVRGQLPMNCRATGRRVPLSVALQKEIARVEQIWSVYPQTYSASGPWLFGDFSIADCMFAPVVFRFMTYGIKVSPPATRYMNMVLGHDAMQEWHRQAADEPEVLVAEEVGVQA